MLYRFLIFSFIEGSALLETKYLMRSNTFNPVAGFVMLPCSSYDTFASFSKYLRILEA